MKVVVDGVEVISLSELQLKVICNDISSVMVDNDLKRRVHYILMHKYERCFDRLKKEWLPKLEAAGVKSVPLNNDEFAKLVFEQAEYKDRAARDSENKVV